MTVLEIAWRARDFLCPCPDKSSAGPGAERGQDGAADHDVGKAVGVASSVALRVTLRTLPVVGDTAEGHSCKLLTLMNERR